MKKRIVKVYIIFFTVILCFLLFGMFFVPTILALEIHWTFAFLYLTIPLLIAIIDYLIDLIDDFGNWWKKRCR